MDEPENNVVGMTEEQPETPKTDAGTSEKPVQAPVLPATEVPAINVSFATAAEKREEKKRKKKFVLFTAILIVVCILVSSVSGAVTSFVVYKIMPEKSGEKSEATSEEPGTEDIIYVTEAPVIVPEEDTAQVTEENIPSEEITQPPAAQPEVTTQEPVKQKTKSDIYNEAVSSVVSITALYEKTYTTIFGTSYTRQYGSTGSGFFISDDGYIVTNYHVIKDGTDINVTTYDENSYKARVVGFDDSNDVAVLKIDAPTHSVTIGCSSDAQVGDDVMVIGNALSMLSYTFTDGVISYKNRKIKTESNSEINMFQTNAAINSGNSGGPVYNMDGAVIGIASAKFASNEIEGLCFFIPIDDVVEKISEIIRLGA